MFSLICAWTNSWANNGDADDLRRHHDHYDVIVMKSRFGRSVWSVLRSMELIMSRYWMSIYWLISPIPIILRMYWDEYIEFYTFPSYVISATDVLGIIFWNMEWVCCHGSPQIKKKYTVRILPNLDNLEVCSGSAIGSPQTCSVWCSGLTTCFLYVCPFGTLFINRQSRWSVSLTELRIILYYLPISIIMFHEYFWLLLVPNL